MLVRIACRPCRIQSLWTDDPHSFLESVCHHRKACLAKLTEEGCMTPVASAKRPAKPSVPGEAATVHRRAPYVTV